MKKNRKIAVLIIGLIAGLVIALTVFYQLPIHRSIDLTVYDGSRNASVIQMDVTLHRSLFSKSTIRDMEGTIQFEGKEYESTNYFNESYFFVDTELLSKGGTAIDLIQSSLHILNVQFDPSYSIVEDIFLIQQTGETDSKIWMTRPSDGQ